METENKKCLVRWPNFSTSVTFALQALKFDEELLDVTLACEGRTVRAHKLVLAASSHYFRQILKEYPCEHPTIVIDGISWKDLLAILHFIYNGQVLVEEEDVCSLLISATSLSVIGLGYVSAALMQNKISDDKENFKDLSPQETNEIEQTDRDDIEENKEEKNDSNNTEIDQNVAIKNTFNYDEVTKVIPSLEPPEKRQKSFTKNKIYLNDKYKKFGAREEIVNYYSNHTNDHSFKSKEGNIQEADLITSKCNGRRQEELVVKKTKDECRNLVMSPVNNIGNGRIINGDKNSSKYSIGKDIYYKDDNQQPPSQNGDINPNRNMVPGTNPNGHMDLGTNPNVHMDLGTNPNGHMDLGANPKGHMDLGTNSNGHMDLGTNPNGHVDLGTNLKGHMDLRANSKWEMDLGTDPTGDMDLGPDPLPMNHPAVLASTSAAAAAIAAAATGNTSMTTMSSVNALNYAALLAANARGILPTTNVGDTSSCSAPPWVSSIKETSPSPPPMLPGNVNPNTLMQFPGITSQELQATLEQYQRKLAFHEPRPCPTCKRMYRDAATLRTHIAIMHSEGKEPFACTCGSCFRTKYDMYQHRKNGHR